MTTFLDWVRSSYLEIIATGCGLIYLFFSIKGNKLLWIFGFITSALYVYICYVAGIYADMGINFYYVIVSIYGWIHWTFYKKEGSVEIPFTRLNISQMAVLLIITGAIYALITSILIRYTDSTIPYWDAFTTSASITATWMLARKIIEHWIIWVIVDAVSIGLYAYKELYSTAILFGVYTVMAIVGFTQWRKKWQYQKL